MRDLSSVAETLQKVQRAKRKFLELWSVEVDYINPMLDRMADDLKGIDPVVAGGTVETEPPDLPSSGSTK